MSEDNSKNLNEVLLRASHYDKVEFECRIVGRSERKSYPIEVMVECTICKSRKIGNIFEHPMLFEYLSVGQQDRVMIILGSILADEPCRGKKEPGELFSHGHHKIERLEPLGDEVDYTILMAEDIQGMGETGQRWKIHLIGKKSPREKLVLIKGIVIKNFRTNNLEILSGEYEYLKDSLSDFKITESDRQNWETYFRQGNDVHLMIAPNIKGASRDLGKMAHVIVAHSVLEIPDITGSQKISGINDALLIGGTTLGKTETIKSFSSRDTDSSDFTFSEYINAETAERTGLTYSIDAENKVLLWGNLVMSDSKMVVIDGIDKFHPDLMSELREVQRQKYVTVNKMVRGEANARTRIIATANPQKDSLEKDYPYPIQGLSLKCFSHSSHMARWDLLIPYFSDVPPEILTHSDEIIRPMPLEVYYRHILWVWTRKPENIKYLSDAIKLIRDNSQELLKRYSSFKYPIVNNGIINLLTKLSVSMACIRHSTDQTHENVIITHDCVEKAYDFYSEILNAWELPHYLENVEQPFIELDENEFATIISELDRNDTLILRELASGIKNSNELSQVTGLAAQSIRKDHFSKLTSFQLIETKSNRGAQLTQKGIAVFKRVWEGGYPKKFVDSWTENQQKQKNISVFVDEESTNQRIKKGTPPQEKAIEAIRLTLEIHGELSEDSLSELISPEIPVKEILPHLLNDGTIGVHPITNQYYWIGGRK